MESGGLTPNLPSRTTPPCRTSKDPASFRLAQLQILVLPKTGSQPVLTKLQQRYQLPNTSDSIPSFWPKQRHSPKPLLLTSLRPAQKFIKTPLPNGKGGAELRKCPSKIRHVDPTPILGESKP
ncbi:unnamed protein product [Prunus armeniaca]|uniref:Uncharacterized protein n=1 Tax=Prunus armeniaca TaxID=36596 RepID=A0A6J5WIA3_PRUAR|nr:unnamed protein product [Prunus armeniaca]